MSSANLPYSEYGKPAGGKILEKISESRVRAYWKKISRYDRELEVRLPMNCYVNGMLHPEGYVWMDLYKKETESGKLFYMRDLWVHDYLRQQGIGTRLVKAVAKEAWKKGADFMLGYFISKGGLRTSAGVFGKENLKMTNFDGEMPIYDELMENFRSCCALTDLRKMDMSKWEDTVRIDPK